MLRRQHRYANQPWTLAGFAR